MATQTARSEETHESSSIVFSEVETDKPTILFPKTKFSLPVRITSILFLALNIIWLAFSISFAVYVYQTPAWNNEGTVREPRPLTYIIIHSLGLLLSLYNIFVGVFGIISSTSDFAAMRLKYKFAWSYMIMLVCSGLFCILQSIANFAFICAVILDLSFVPGAVIGAVAVVSLIMSFYMLSTIFAALYVKQVSIEQLQIIQIAPIAQTPTRNT